MEKRDSPDRGESGLSAQRVYSGSKAFTTGVELPVDRGLAQVGAPIWFSNRTVKRTAIRGEVTAQGALEPFVRQKTVLLTTYRRNGAPVGTPVNIAVEGARAFVRTWDTAWKLKRIRNNPEVEIAPSTFRGKPMGPAIRARARVLSDDESAHAGQALARKHPILHGILVPLIHRLRGNKTMHIEVTPVAGGRAGDSP